MSSRTTDLNLPQGMSIQATDYDLAEGKIKNKNKNKKGTNTKTKRKAISRHGST